MQDIPYNKLFSSKPKLLEQRRARSRNSPLTHASSFKDKNTLLQGDNKCRAKTKIRVLLLTEKKIDEARN